MVTYSIFLLFVLEWNGKNVLNLCQVMPLMVAWHSSKGVWCINIYIGPSSYWDRMWPTTQAYSTSVIKVWW